MPGPKPKPSQMKKLQGTHRADRAAENEPMPAIGDVPVCPDWHPEDAREMWDAYAPKLHRLGLLTELDVPVFEKMCLCHAWAIEAARDIIKRGTLIDSARNDDDRVKNPSMQIFRDNTAQFEKLAAAFGMSPADRSRVSAAELPREEKESLLTLVERKKAQ